MAPLLSSTAPAALGKGRYYPGGSISDPEIAILLQRYKRNVASRYRSLRPDELSGWLPPGPFQVSPKLDGELWFAIADAGEVVLVGWTGKAIAGDVPVLSELKETLGRRAVGRTVVAGELFAVIPKAGRPRVGDVSATISAATEADAGRLAFHAFDLVSGGDAKDPQPSEDWQQRHAVLNRLLDGGKRCRPIRNEVANTHDEVAARFVEWVDGGKAEGLVVRVADGRIFKVKPQFSMDLAVLGYTVRTDGEELAGSLILGLLRPDNHFHVVGSVANLGDEDARRAILKRLAPTAVPSDYRHASSSGELFQFVHPEMVVEVRATDLLNEESGGTPIRRMVLTWDGKEYRALRAMPGVSLLFPVLVRIRDDKSVNPVDVRISQVTERCQVNDLEAAATALELPRSEITRREVYTKETKGVTAVRKLVVWRTHKESVAPEFPAWVVHWTDYSPGRKDPLQREVRLAPDEATATSVAQALLEENVKKGWIKRP